MRTMEDKLAMDISIFGRSLTETIFLNSWKKRIWGACKVLNGEAGIIIHRIDPIKKGNQI